jgi:type II secretory pathway predicted ATPase ExeA
MYEIFFGLHSRPFGAAPRAECYFPAATIEAALQTLTRCIERAEGAGMVVGPSGTGKTLLCQILAARFRDRLDVVVLSNGRLGSRRALLQGILHGLAQPYRDMDEGELRIALADYLCGPKATSRGLLLVADEAHTLPLRCLDELRMVTNLALHGQPRARLVLVGAPLLEERLAHPRLDSFSQRMAARCYLEAMTRLETEGYIRAQIGAAGGNGAEIFPPETCTAAYHATGGVPRLVNQVCDHALVLAHAAGQRRIDPARIQEAWADLQQLPTPWNSEPRREQSAAAVIEFGSLDDEASAGSPSEVSAAPQSPSAAPVAAVCPTSAATETAGAGVCEPPPEQPLVEIQEMLGELEEVFRPAGSIRPEVEIVLDDPINPFNEPFLEEEIVVDRRAAALAQRNSEAVAMSSRADRPGDARKAESLEVEVREESPAHENQSESVASSGAQVAAAERETLPLPSVIDPIEDDLGEPEVVIDENYDFVEPIQAHPATPVRPQQYRHLFAQLRRA